MVLARQGDSGPASLLNVVVDAAYDTESIDQFQMRLADGETVAAFYMSTKFETQTGTGVGEAYTTVSFPFDDFAEDIEGNLVMFVGDGFDIRHGDWSLELHPAE